ncbi:MAG: hypothetical protein B7Z73_15185 [Planctomycetia bacterium 21-64-5]|nr:MAG: hypothetical protein B7Z73_15185 [Planctomycetia bacterium 21-64-5]
MVHRDLKPAKILIARDGTPKITDFGLAKRLEDATGRQSRSRSVLGTPASMSQEQASGRVHEVGPAADIYAFGAMLYEMLAGRVPLRGASVLDTLQQIVRQEPVPPTQLDPKVPRDLEAARNQRSVSKRWMCSNSVRAASGPLCCNLELPSFQ